MKGSPVRVRASALKVRLREYFSCLDGRDRALHNCRSVLRCGSLCREFSGAKCSRSIGALALLVTLWCRKLRHPGVAAVRPTSRGGCLAPHRVDAGALITLLALVVLDECLASGLFEYRRSVGRLSRAGGGWNYAANFQSCTPKKPHIRTPRTYATAALCSAAPAFPPHSRNRTHCSNSRAAALTPPDGRKRLRTS
jgi:hypothetical protein